MPDNREFFSPRSRYYGKWKPEYVAFDANLQEFAHRISLICALETGGKLSPEQAYNEIRQLWHQLKRSKEELGIGDTPNDTNPE